MGRWACLVTKPRPLRPGGGLEWIRGCARWQSRGPEWLWRCTGRRRPPDSGRRRTGSGGRRTGAGRRGARPQRMPACARRRRVRPQRLPPVAGPQCRRRARSPALATIPALSEPPARAGFILPGHTMPLLRTLKLGTPCPGIRNVGTLNLGKLGHLVLGIGRLRAPRPRAPRLWCRRPRLRLHTPGFVARHVPTPCTPAPREHSVPRVVHPRRRPLVHASGLKGSLLRIRCPDGCNAARCLPGCRRGPSWTVVDHTAKKTPLTENQRKRAQTTRGIDALPGVACPRNDPFMHVGPTLPGQS